jgi:4-hydroxybenzoate polyprenyltransferase
MNKISLISKSLKIHETLFTLPLAYFGTLFASNGSFELKNITLVTIALVLIRSFGMGINRYIDLEIDKLNVRTKSRPLASGSISKNIILFVILVCAALFIVFCYFINEFAFYCSFIVVIIMWIYPYTKRFTFLCSFVLGFILSIAPVGGWVVVRSSMNLDIYLFSLAIMLWASSFDMIYHTQDYNFQKKYNLKSFGSKFGIKNTFIFAVFLDLLSMVVFVCFGYSSELKIIYFIGCLIGLLIHLIKYIRNWPKSDKINLRPEFFRWNTMFSLIISSFAIISII